MALNCSKYGKDKANANPSDPPKTRRKRHFDDENQGMIIDGKLVCRYNEDLNRTAIASWNEEIQWQKLTANPEGIENLLCDDSIGENCILRILHSPEATFYWKKRFDAVEGTFILEESAIVNNPPLNIPISKEILSLDSVKKQSLERFRIEIERFKFKRSKI